MVLRTSFPAGAKIDPDVRIAEGVAIADEGVVILSGARLDVGSVIGPNVEIGRNAWVRAGAVVLRPVPPNAIVEGNPAEVVGYQSQGRPGAPQGDIRLIDVQRFDTLDRPSKVDLGVGGCALHLMRNVEDVRGSLTVGEVSKELPFAPARYFAVYGVPSVELRGEHAHRRCEQFLLCLHGSVRVLLDDGEDRCELLLDRPDIGVHMPAMTWGTQYRYSADAVLLVFASRPYENEDYLRTYEEFLAARAAR